MDRKLYMIGNAHLDPVWLWRWQDGYEAARAIRASAHPEAQAIPIIAMTANAFAEDVQKSIDAGMNVHLSKPIDMCALKGVLMEYVRSDNRQGSAV